MPIAPNPDNYTTGAMPKLYFQRAGGSEVHVGCISASSIEPTLEFLDHFCSQSGSRVKDKSVVTQKGLQIHFNWDELNLENIRGFLYGDAPTSIGAGTDTAVNEEHLIPAEGLVKLENDGVTSVVLAFKPDVVVHFDDSAEQYTDYTSQLEGAGNTGSVLVDAGTIGADTVDVLYVGHDSKFDTFTVAMSVAATLGSAVVMYEMWTGAGWTNVTADVTGAGKSFDGNGAVILDNTTADFTNWVKTVLQFGNLGASANKYWLRIHYTTADPGVAPTFDTLMRTFTENTDYAVVPAEGYVFRLSTGDIMAGLKVDAGYTFTTTTSRRFNVLADTVIEGQARLEFRPNVGVGFDYFIPRASLKTNGAFEFSDTGWISPPSTLEVLDASTQGYADSPFGYLDVYD